MKKERDVISLSKWLATECERRRPMCRITFRPETVKRLKEELEKAYMRGDKQAVRRLSVLIMVGQRMSLASILAVWNVSAQTVYNWLDEFARYYWKSLVYKKAPGRPSS